MFWDVFYDSCKQNRTSPNAVCKAIGLSNATASGWKSGTLPKADILVKIADHLNVSVDYLLGRDKPVQKVASESDWMNILNGLSDESLIQLRDYSRYLLWKQDQERGDYP